MSNNGGVYTWSTTAAANATADSTVNWAAGMAPSSVSPSGRSLMASVAKYRDDISGMLVSSASGTSTSYIVSSNQLFDSAADMHLKTIAFTPNVTNTAGSPSVTLTVDGFAGPLRTAPNTELLGNTLIAGTPYLAIYNNTDKAFYLQGFFGQQSIPLGGMIDYVGSVAPFSNWVIPIGQALSRTAFATLFALIGTTYGVGDGSTTFNVPNLSGRVVAQLDLTGTILTSATMTPNGNTLGAIGGGQNATLIIGQIPNIGSNVNVNVSGGVTVNTVIGAGGVNANAPNTTSLNGAGANTQNFPGSGSFSGSGTGTATSSGTGGSAPAHANVQPTIALNKIMRII